MMKYVLISGVALTASTAWGQFPTSKPVQVAPPPANEPGRLPNDITRPYTGQVPLEIKPKTTDPKPALDANGMPLPKPDVPLARTERVSPLGKIDVKFTNNNWQVWAGPHVFANFGSEWKSAEKTAGTLQAMQTGETGKSTIGDVQQTGWATLGETRPVIGYMTMRGEAIRSFKGVSNTSIPLDLASVRTEAIRGVWVVRDANNILLNFGQEEREAEQAVAVAKRYGFNRIGFVGATDSPSLRYFFTAAEIRKQEVAGANQTNTALTAMMQEFNLDRTGIDVPGVGTVGHKINIDPKKLDIRRDGSDFVLAQGGDVLAKFGRDEFSARDAQRAIQQMRPTAFVRIGTPGITFFLAGAEPPNRLPFGTMGAAFDPDRLFARQTLDGMFHLYDPLGREIAVAGTKADAEAIRIAIKHYKLNRTCQIGSTPAHALTFLGRAN